MRVEGNVAEDALHGRLATAVQIALKATWLIDKEGARRRPSPAAVRHIDGRDGLRRRRADEVDAVCGLVRGAPESTVVRHLWQRSSWLKGRRRKTRENERADRQRQASRASCLRSPALRCVLQSPWRHRRSWRHRLGRPVNGLRPPRTRGRAKRSARSRGRRGGADVRLGWRGCGSRVKSR